MLAFRPYDTNSTMQQQKLGISPPTKKCAKSPGKVPLHADLLYRVGDSAEADRDFKFNLQSISVSSSSYSSEPPRSLRKTTENNCSTLSEAD